eukprot:jgi/Psemu1/285945/fgenesh1_pg.109_\
MIVIKIVLRGVVFFGSLHIGSNAFAFQRCRPLTTEFRQSPESHRLLLSTIPYLSTDCESAKTSVDGESFTEILLGRLRRNDTSPVVVEGYVTSKRSIGKNLAFLDFQVDHEGSDDKDSDHNLCQALLRKDLYEGDFHAGYRRCLLKGCKFRLTGVASPTRIPGNVVLMLKSMELLALPRQSQHIQIVLEHAVDGAIPFKQVLLACSDAEPNFSDGDKSIRLELDECRDFLTGGETNITGIGEGEDDSLTEMARRKVVSLRLKRLSKQILSALPHDPQYPAAADQRSLSREGNYIVPPAPREWQMVPERLQRDIEMSEKSIHDSTKATPSIVKERTVKEALLEMTKIAERKNSDGQTSARVSVNAWVQNRRRFGDNVTMIYLVDEMMNPSFENQDPIQGNTMIGTSSPLPCLLHPEVLSGKDTNDCGMYQNLIGAGSKISVQGRILLPDGNEIKNDEDERSETKSRSPPHVWVESIRLVRSSYNSVTIRHLLDLLFEKRIGAREVSEALLIPFEEAKRLSFQSDATERQWKANLLAIQLQKELSPSSIALGRVDPILLEVMEKYRHFSKIHPVIAESIEREKAEGGGNKNKDEGISENYSNGAKNDDQVSRQDKVKRSALGMPGSKWQTKKKPQLEWMSRQIRTVLESHPDFKNRELTILDIGGGKGQLANHLGKSLGKFVRVHVVDICQGAVRNGKKKAERLDLPVDFQFADASNSNLLDAVDADVVVALHACGHLSDVALNHAIHRRAGFVIVPCCFNSNPHLMIPESKINTLTSVPEWLGIPPGDWSALKLLAEVQGNIPLASEAIGIICAIRAQAAHQKMTIEKNRDEAIGYDSVTDDSEGKIAIKSFPIQYSTRNTVLVGKCS